MDIGGGEGRTEGTPVSVVVCADDFGISPGVSRGIAELLAAGRISATSCMTVGGAWEQAGPGLIPLSGRAEIGLHLTLTDAGAPRDSSVAVTSGGLPGPGGLLRASLSGNLNRRDIEAEIENQLDRFERVLERSPDFLDGHHHTHQFPVVREALVEVYERRLRGTGTYLRNTVESPLAILRRRVAVGRALAMGGFGRPARAMARQRAIPTNDGFAGIYDFSRRYPYRALFQRFLTAQRGGGIIVCHPGYVDDDLTDPLTWRREDELGYLAGPDFPEDLRAAGVRLGRLASP